MSPAKGGSQTSLDGTGRLSRTPWAWLWAVSLILAWSVVAARLDQPIIALQHSRDLVGFGAVRGVDFTPSESWRLLASQWLHVKFPHMLFNALIIGLVGQASGRGNGWPLTIAVGVLGGALAQLLTLHFNPTAYISGASQAYLALCGLALLTLPIRSIRWWSALLAVGVAAGLDLFVSSQGVLKVGHIAGFAAGVAAGLAVLRWPGLAAVPARSRANR